MTEFPKLTPPFNWRKPHKNDGPGIERPVRPWAAYFTVIPLVLLIAGVLILHVIKDVDLNEILPRFFIEQRNEQAKQEETRIHPDMKLVKEFTLWHKIKMGKFRVDTGHVFKSSKDKRPYREYCYAKPSEAQLIEYFINLAKRDGTAPVQYFTLTEKAASLLGLDIEAARKLGREKCRFMEGSKT